jgi:hypothetical protein
MTRLLFPAIVIGALAVPAAALAQHSRGADTPSSGTAVSSAPAPAPSSSGPTSSSSGGSTGGQSSSGSTGSTSSEPGRSRGNSPGNGTAVARGSVPGSGGTIVITDGSGFYPWGYGFGGAIAGGFGGYYGGYYGAYDPWYGWSPTYAPASYGGSDNTGSLRLKVKPEAASVYVDGFYVGIIDDFDGTFQRLHLDRGPHRIEMRQRNYAPLAVDVMIQENFTITYRGELAKE